jgi:hypothetical protein
MLYMHPTHPHQNLLLDFQSITLRHHRSEYNDFVESSKKLSINWLIGRHAGWLFV